MISNECSPSYIMFNTYPTDTVGMGSPVKTLTHKGHTYEVYEISNTFKDGKPAPEPIYRGMVKGQFGFTPFEVFESHFTGKKPIGTQEIDAVILETLTNLTKQDQERYWLEHEIESNLPAGKAYMVERYGNKAFIARAAKLAKDGKIESSYVETKGYAKVNTYRAKGSE